MENSSFGEHGREVRGTGSEYPTRMISTLLSPVRQLTGTCPAGSVLLVDGLAVLTRPDEFESSEGVALEKVLRQSGRSVVHIQAPGRVDARDVVRAGRLFFIGLSTATNRAGAVQLGACISGLGYSSRILDVMVPPFLSSGVVYSGDSTLILADAYGREPAFRDFRRIMRASNDPIELNRTAALEGLS